MKLLVTGGAGFIGSHFIRYMLRRFPTYEIVNLDALTYAGNRENLRDAESNARYSFVHGDITDARRLTDIQNNIEAVVHFAAESHVDRSVAEPGAFVRTNVLGTQTLLEAARRHNVRRFIQISTDEVYDSLGETGLFNGNSPLAPNSPYAASKAGGDLMARAYRETYGLPVIITRCSNNYGPCQYPEKLIPRMIGAALENPAAARLRRRIERARLAVCRRSLQGNQSHPA